MSYILAIVTDFWSHLVAFCNLHISFEDVYDNCKNIFFFRVRFACDPKLLTDMSVLINPVRKFINL